MPADQNNDNWGEYSRLVLNQLDRLVTEVHGLQTQMSQIKVEIGEIRAQETRVESLENWKSRVDEIVSPTQLQQKLDEIEKLKTFKTQAMMVFSVVQVAWAIFTFGADYL
jgi:hypothetical protein